MTAYERVTLKGGWRVTFDNGRCGERLLNELVPALADYPVSPPVVTEGWTLVGSSKNSSVWSFSLDGGEYVFKEYLRRGPFESLKALVNGSRAQRAWKAGCLLSEKGFLSPPLVAWGVKSRLGVPSRNFLVTGFVPDTCGLFTLLNEHFPVLAPGERFRIKSVLIPRLGRAIGRLHSEGIIHGDLRLNNILVKGWQGEEPEFYFIDNERNAFFERPPLGLIVKNLVQVGMVTLPWVRRTDRARFFKAYISRLPRLSASRRSLAKEVWAVTKDRVEKLGVSFV